jgi:hypothetical protein
MWDYSRQIDLWSHKNCQGILFFIGDCVRPYGILYRGKWCHEQDRSTQKADDGEAAWSIFSVLKKYINELEPCAVWVADQRIQILSSPCGQQVDLNVTGCSVWMTIEDPWPAPFLSYPNAKTCKLVGVANLRGVCTGTSKRGEDNVSSVWWRRFNQWQS